MNVCPHCGKDIRYSNMTPRMWQILEYLIQGLPNEVIGEKIGITGRTVKAFNARIFDIFGISGADGRVKLATFLYRKILCMSVQTGTETNTDLEFHARRFQELKSKSLSELIKDFQISQLPENLEKQNKLSRTTLEKYMTRQGWIQDLSLHSGSKQESLNI